MVPRGHVPEPHTIVVASRGQGLTVRREGDRRRPRRCGPRNVYLLPSWQSPQR